MNWTTLKVGDRIAECGYNKNIHSTVITAPAKENGRIRFKSATDEGAVIDYAMTEGWSAYSPSLKKIEPRNKENKKGRDNDCKFF